MKIVKFLWYIILAIVTAVTVCGGSVLSIIGLYGLFETLFNKYPDLYVFTLISLIGVCTFRIGWLLFDKVIIENHIKRNGNN